MENEAGRWNVDVFPPKTYSVLVVRSLLKDKNGKTIRANNVWGTAQLIADALNNNYRKGPNVSFTVAIRNSGLDVSYTNSRWTNNFPIGNGYAADVKPAMNKLSEALESIANEVVSEKKVQDYDFIIFPIGKIEKGHVGASQGTSAGPIPDRICIVHEDLLVSGTPSHEIGHLFGNAHPASALLNGRTVLPHSMTMGYYRGTGWMRHEWKKIRARPITP
jgi:hypothetical protein